MMRYFSARLSAAAAGFSAVPGKLRSIWDSLSRSTLHYSHRLPRISKSIRRYVLTRFVFALAGPPFCHPRVGESLGARGERVAAKFLRRTGMTVVGCGVRDGLGELDIVAIDRRTVVYVEVKTRRSDALERPADAVDRDKRFRICRAAAAFAKRNGVEQCRTRFDIVEVVWPDDKLPPRINHIVSAFESELE